MKPFVVFGLPRSRTYWLSRFLTYGGWHCGHDELLKVRSLDDVKSWLSMPFTGTVETAAAPWWRLLKHYKPDANIVIIRRPVGEVLQSLYKLGYEPSRDLTKRMEYLAAKLSQIEVNFRVLTYDYKELNSREACKNIFERCLPYEFDESWWASIRTLNLQINFPAMLRYVAAHDAQLSKFSSIAKQHSLSLISQKEVTSQEGLTFQQESLADFIEGGQDLFKQHAVAVGEPTDTWQTKNIPLMQVLEDLGCLQITTARCNGRMFGYLMAVMSPSLEHRDLKSGIHTLFYASPEFKGIGLKLQRASINALAERGCSEITFQAGVRGSGNRIAAIYKRMGAVNNGELYKLTLNS